MSTSTEAVPAKPPVKRLKPARKQCKKGEFIAPQQEQTGKEYNIWYNKWAGGDKGDNMDSQQPALSRCILARDSGYTRADATGTKYCCIYFARGACPLGSECSFLHRLPPPTHVLPDAALDCFGRDKFADYRDDMGGVGSFGRVNRTLYIGRIREDGSKADTEEKVRRHFGEWGQLARVNILHTRGVAFVTYVHELNAQFAKMAMSNQALDAGEVLNVRWATEDPNPAQIRVEKRRVEHEGKKAIEGKIDAGFAEAAMAVQALEEGREEDLYALPGETGGESRGNKRARIEQAEAPEAAAEVDDDEAATMQAEIDAAYAEAAAQEAQEEAQMQAQVQATGGLLDRDALEGMKYFLQVKRQREEATKMSPPKVESKPALGLLGGYGSDEEDD